MAENKLRPEVSDKIGPFTEALKATLADRLQAMAVMGRATLDTEDFSAKRVESVVVLSDLELATLERIAPLGRKFGSRGVASPVLVTPSYIEQSLDVFPLEFLNIQLAHVTIHGPELFNDLSINRADLRRQCERELKAFLIRLRQSYLAATGKTRALAPILSDANENFAAIVRGLLHLIEAPIGFVARNDLATLHAKLELDGTPPSLDAFEPFYSYARRLSDKVDKLQ